MFFNKMKLSDRVLLLFKNVLGLFSKHHKKPYLYKLLDNIEKQESKNKNLPFKITDIREKGFIVSVCGLRGYISFMHMPWKYSNYAAWNLVFPYIQKKVFFSKVYKTQRNPVSIMLNGEIPQFREPELVEDNSYEGIIINKVNYGFFVDIGYAFNWSCGSIVGLLHKSNFDTIEQFERIGAGEIIKLKYWGKNNKKQLVFGLNNELKPWFTLDLENIFGKKVAVTVEKQTDGSTKYLVYDKLPAILQINIFIYPTNKTKIEKALINIEHKETIHCKVIEVDKTNKILRIKWDTLSEIEELYSRNKLANSQSNRRKTIISTTKKINNITSKEIARMRNLVGKTVSVKVVKENNGSKKTVVKYLVEDKYTVNLKITNDFFSFGHKEINHIESILENGEILNCKALGIKKNTLVIQWDMDKNELLRFFR